MLVSEENLTIAFDAITQEGKHVNSIQVTNKDTCYVLAVDELPGGTTDDSSMHINATIDSLSDVYCQLYSTDFTKIIIRYSIMSPTSSQIVLQYNVYHSTIKQLELDWGKNVNELNCHLHPLDSIASGIRTVLKSSEPQDVCHKLLVNDCISHTGIQQNTI